MSPAARRYAVAPAAFLLGGAAVGCTADAVPPAEVRDAGYDCGYELDDIDTLSWTVNPRPGSVPPGFDPVEAVWCSTPSSPRLGADENREFTVTEIRTTELTPLIERFADPGEELYPDGVECAALHYFDSIDARVWLIDADGRAILGHAPSGVCGPDDTGLSEAFGHDR